MRLFLLFIVCLLITCSSAFSQVGDRLSAAEVRQLDSMAIAFRATDRRVQQVEYDSVISLLIHKRNESEGKLLEAKRAERHANELAIESRSALRNEKQVQRQNKRMDRHVDKWRRKYGFDEAVDSDVDR